MEGEPEIGGGTHTLCLSGHGSGYLEHTFPQLSNMHKALAFSHACPQQSVRTTQDKRSSIPRRVEGRQSQKEQEVSIQARRAVHAEEKLGSWGCCGHEAGRADKAYSSPTEELHHLRKFVGRGAAALP